MKKLICVLVLCLMGFALFAEDVSVSIEDKVAYPQSWTCLSKEERNLKLINILTNISSQKGVQYISRMAGYKPKTLFEDSYCISNLDKAKSRIDDPVFTQVPDSYTLYAYQKDNRFGGNTFTLDYTVTDDGIKLSIVNHTAMKFAGYTCVKPEKLTMTLEVIHNENDMTVKGYAFAPDQKAKINLLVYTVEIDSSFERRITALKNWFVDQFSVF